MIRPELVLKLAAMRPPQEERDLEEAFSQYQDRHWVSVQGCTTDRVWRLILFGFSFADRFRAAGLAHECFLKLRASFETQASSLQKQILGAKSAKDATPYVQLDHNLRLEIIQYLALSGMPWHLAQRWNLLSLPRIRESVQEMNQDDTRWIPTLFCWFGHQFQLEELSDSDWIKFELFCWRNQALKGVAWMDFLEDWARGDDKRTILLKNLKDIFLFTRCRHLFRERTNPPQPDLTKAVKPIKPLERESDDLQMIAIEDHVPPPLPPRLFTRLSPERKEVILTEKESLKSYLIQRTLSELERYRLRIPKALQADMERLLLGVPQQREHEAQIHRNCLSLLELADRVDALLSKKNEEAIPQALKIADSLFPEERQGGLYPPGNERGLNLFMETAIHFSFFYEKINLSDDTWQDTFFTLLGLCNNVEKKQLLQQIKTLPCRDEKIASTAPDVIRRLDEAHLFSPFRLASLFLHLLAKFEDPLYLTHKETLRLWKKMEEFLGPLRNPDIIFNLFYGTAIPRYVLASLETFSPCRNPNALFLPTSYFKEQDHLINQLVKGFIGSQPIRKSLVESLALATLQEDPVFVPTLKQFKGFANVSEESLGTVIPLAKELKLPIAGDRHLHCVSTWRYHTAVTQRNAKTLATFECTLFFLDYLRAVTFSVDLPDFLPVEFFEDQYSSQFVSLFRNLIDAFSPERYLENQEELQTLIQDSDEPHQIRDKVIAALEKLHWVNPLREFTYYINPQPGKTDPERLNKALALVKFLFRIKFAFRQALYHRADYDRIEAMPFNQGWQFFTPAQRGFSVAQLQRVECQPIVDQIYQAMQTGRSASFRMPVLIGEVKKELNLDMSSSRVQRVQPHYKLNVAARLADKEEIADNLQWLLSFPEPRAKELIFLLLCKVAFHKKWRV